ncbi:MAG: hypothetical protein HY960_00005, partial [Ignavibacteriae bacterium]|nr:hypothetical protein [Ignavibacteriota bacterium]
VMTAEQINSGSSNTTNAWKYMLNGEASDYWYWDGSQNGIWDSHPTRAVNQAVQYAQSVVNSGSDLTGPTIFQPQREPYNPGATEWGINQPSDMTVWTYVFDVHGLKSVKLKYRTDVDGVNSTSSSQNETYSGGSEVNAWVELNMSGVTKSSTTNPSPLYKAKEFSAQITGLNNVLLDYYVEAVDSFDNVSKSVISHVWIGQNSGGGGGESGVSWSPVNPTNNDTITITVSGATQGAKLHWGVNNVGSSWQTPNSVYRPAGSTLFNGTGPAVESPMTGPDTASKLTIKLGPFNNVAQAVSKIAFVIHYNDNTWDNNSGQDYHIELPDTSQPTQTFTMDGQLDVSAQSVASNGGLNLYLGWNNTELYVATQSAQQQGGDMFIFVSDSQRAVTTAQWAKAGSVAAWDVFLGNESSNNWNGWFDKGTSTTVTNSAGTYLEGTINILQEFGKIPAKLYIAVGKYQTPDGGSLTAQVPAGNGNGNIEPTELYEFDYTFSGVSPPAAPNLSSPSNGATNQTTTVSLQWSASSGATLYHVALSIDSTFTATIVNDSNVSSTGKSVSSLSYSTKYYWRARAKNAGGWGDWSATWNFTTMAQPQPPDTPVLLFPPNDTTNILRDVTCQWQSSSGATAYHIAVSKDSAFATTIVNDSLVNSTFKQVSSLSINTTYYWRVRAKNSVGWSAWTSVRNFTSGNPYPRVSIHDIQFVPDSLLVCLDEGVCPPSSQYSQYVGDTVTITALCIAPPRTLKFGGGFSLLVSDTGAYGLWKGVLVIANSSDTNQLISDGIMEIKRGKVFEMLCVVNEFSGEPLVTNTHLTPLPGNSIKILGTKNVPIPIKSNLTDVKKYQTAEPREGIYTYITDVVVIGYINVGGGTAFTVVDDIGNEVTITRLTIDQEIPLPELYSSIDTLRGLVYSVFSSPYPAYSKCYITPITPSDIVYASHYVSPTSLNFGYAQVDSSRIGSFCFYNQLGTSITVQSIVSTNPVFTVFPETTTIPARSSKSFNVTFTPTNTGDFSGYILLTHTASSQPESIFVNGTGVSYAPIDVSISVFEGWNLLSLPVLAGNDSVHHIFPQALSQPFFFDHSNGYGTSQRIERGKGYWLKFDTTQNISVSGFQIDADTIDVKAGWNLIGTISEPVSIDSVISIPDGIISSQFFGYHFGYVSPTVLEPAKGYWVKVSQDGKIYLSGTTMYKR